MNIDQLKALIHAGESEILEFKTSTGSLTSAMQTTCAFLNSDHGGTIIFGVTDKGQIVGQAVSDKTRKDIATELNKLEPYIKIPVKYIPIENDLHLIVFQVPADDKGPYLYDGRAFVRNQSTTIRMSREEFMYLYNVNNPVIWESLMSNNCTFEDLDFDRIKEVMHEAVLEKRLPKSVLNSDTIDVLTKLKLIVNGKLTNAAVILFCKDEDKQFMQAQVKLARFRGTTKSQFLDTQVYIGNAFDLYDKIMKYLNFCLPTAAHIQQGNPVRVETPTIPYSVLREAVTNALVHRDYSNPGGAIDVAIYDDRVNIMNMGALPKGIKIDKLTTAHTSVQRNPLIANVFYVCGKIEKWGRGTLDMIADCKVVGNPLPQYEEIGGVFSITLPFQHSIGTLQPKIQPQHMQPQVTAPQQLPAGLTKRQQQILHLLQAEPLTRQELMAKMDTQFADRTIQLELMTLKKAELVACEGKANNTIWFAIHK